MATDLQAVLDELTAYPSTEHPFLSIYLDVTPDGTGNRQSLVNLDQEFDRIAGQIKNRGGNLESFEADRDRVKDYLNVEMPAESRGVAIFACNAEGVWNAVPLQVPVETQIYEDRYPHVFNLARIIDDYETYAVVLVDSQESRIFVISLSGAEKAAAAEADEEIKRFQAGGWGQMLFQRRTDNLIKAHHKEMADKLGRVIKRYDVQHVIIAGNDSIKGSVRESLPKQIQDMLVDFVHLDVRSNMQSIMETIEPMIREVERAQEADDVADLETEVNSKGGLGYVGMGNVATALYKGQVRMLLILQDFNAMGGECPNCGALRPGMRQTCPFDGADMQQVDLREAFVTRAHQQNAVIQIVESNDFLAQHDGVGALLYYRDDVSQEQAV
jgi:peptide chain release factor subunit 1